VQVQGEPPIDEALSRLNQAEQKLEVYGKLMSRLKSGVSPEMTLLARLTTSAGASPEMTPMATALTDAEVVSADLWSLLVDARDTLAGHGLDVSNFDEIRTSGLGADEICTIVDEQDVVTVGGTERRTSYAINDTGVTLADLAISELYELVGTFREPRYADLGGSTIQAVWVDEERCRGCEECTGSVPDVFAWDDEHEVAYVLVNEIPATLEKGVRNASELCPEKAIVVEQSDQR
jgi:ferredoxin